jgi:beta-lactamase class D
LESGPNSKNRDTKFRGIVFPRISKTCRKRENAILFDAVKYGNQDISGNINSFWLKGGLRISADEQVQLLIRLYKNDLPFSQRNLNIVKRIIVMEKTEAYQLSGKTGSAEQVMPHEGWYVGYLETNGNVYFFAINYENVNPDGMASSDAAMKISKSILTGLCYLQ